MRHLLLGAFAFSLALAAILSPLSSAAQSLSTATRTSEFAVFGGIEGVMPAYTSAKNYGGSAGAMFTRYLSFPVAPSLIVRGDYNAGPDVNEQSVVFGLRGQTDLKTRFHPYANVMVGGGIIKFAYPPKPGFNGDRGAIIAYGGGVDMDVTEHFQAKLDFLQTRWNFGNYNPNGQQVGSYLLYPRSLTVGFVYKLPFRPHTSRQ